MRTGNISAWLGLLFCFSMLCSGCSRLGSAFYTGEYEPGVIRVWATGGDDAVDLQALFDRYSQENRQAVKVLGGLKSKRIQEALTSATPPEIVILNSNALVGLYNQQGLIAPLEPLIEATGIDLEDFYPAPLAQCEIQAGAHICLPWGSDIQALFWNKDLFEAAGLDPERPPQTMEELTEYARKLTRRDEQGELVQVGFIPDFPRSHAGLYARMLGGGWFNPGDGQLIANAQAVIKAQEWQLEFFNLYGFEQANQFVSGLDRYRDSSHPIYAGQRLNCQQCHRQTFTSIGKLPDNGFYKGQVAMMVDGQWQVGARYITAVQPALNYGVAPFPPPAGHPERANTTVVEGPVVIIPARAPNKQAAANLLAWMMSPDVAAVAAYTQSSLPASRIASQDPRFQEIPNYSVFMGLIAHPNAGYSFSHPLNPEINQALGQAEQDLLHENGGEPSARMNEIQARLAP